MTPPEEDTDFAHVRKQKPFWPKMILIMAVGIIGGLIIHYVVGG